MNIKNNQPTTTINVYQGGVVNIDHSGQPKRSVSSGTGSLRKSPEYNEIEIKFRVLTSRYAQLSNSYASSVTPFAEYIKEKGLVLPFEDRLDIEEIEKLIQEYTKTILGLQARFINTSEENTERLLRIFALTKQYVEKYETGLGNYCGIMNRVMESSQLTEEEKLERELAELKGKDIDLNEVDDEEWEKLGEEFFGMTEEKEAKAPEVKEEVVNDGVTNTGISATLYGYTVGAVASGITNLSRYVYGSN